MKKIWTFLIGFLFLFALIACTPPNGTDNDDDDDDNGNQTEEATASIAGAANVTITAGDSFDPLEGVTATDEVDGDITASIDVEGAVLTNTPGNYEITYKVTGSDGKEVTVVRQVTVLEGSNQEPPTEVVIMHGAVYEIDPFHDDYTGREQLNRQQKQQEVEDRLNVRVVYKQYPESAAWGPDRVTAINNAAIAGQPLADIYWTTSDWIQQLVEGNSVVAVDNYIKDGIGTNISAEAKEIGTFRNKVYAFMAGKPTVDTGLYFNSALITELGLEDPAQIFLDGEWTWSRFQTWATQAKGLLSQKGEGHFVMGGVPAVWAEQMVPLNGGSLINAKAKQVSFHQTKALETYDFVQSLWEGGYFEPNGTYDAGSAIWQAGQVLIHPGSLWFVTAPNRWGNLAFNVDFVPYPMSDSFDAKDYVSPISGVAMYNLAAGLTPQKEALAFEVWNEIQLWKTDAELKNEFEITLEQRFNNQASIDAYLQVYDKVTLDLIGALGISRFTGGTGFYSVLNNAIYNDSVRTEMERIRPIYTERLNQYYGIS